MSSQEEGKLSSKVTSMRVRTGTYAHMLILFSLRAFLAHFSNFQSSALRHSSEQICTGPISKALEYEVRPAFFPIHEIFSLLLFMRRSRRVRHVSSAFWCRLLSIVAVFLCFRFNNRYEMDFHE